MFELRSVRERSQGQRDRGRSSMPRASASIVPNGNWPFRFFLMALVAVSILAVCIENGLHPAFLVLVPVVMAALGRSDYGRPLIWSERVITALFAMYVVLFTLGLIHAYGRLSAPLFLVHFTVGIIIVRTLAPLTDRNISQLILLSAGLVLINCILTNNMLFGIALVVYLFCLMGTLLYFNLARSSAGSAEMIRRSSVRPDPQRWTISIAKHLALILVLSAALFLMVPRPFAVIPGLRGGVPGTGTPADLKHQISYRDIANMAGLYRIAFRVRFDREPLPGLLYWRGRVLDQTDGASWSASEKLRSRYIYVRVHPSEVFSYMVFPYRLQSNIVHACGMAVYALGRGGKPLLINARREVIVDSVFLVSDSYEVQAVNRRIPVSSRDTDYLDATAVPSRIRDLALAWTRGAVTPRQKAEMLLARFKTGFKYELRVMPPPRDVNPLEHFLFQTRTGNCEYFAGALGLMLRAVDVPSRLVEGFMGMEETGDTNEFIVRFSHAHAWVESILEGTHWTTLDPTPPGAFQLPHVVWLWLTDFYDNLEFEWLRGVVNFDRSDQLILLRGISGLFSGQAWSSVPALFQSGSWYLVTAAAAVFVLIAVLIAGTFRIHRKSPSAIYAGTMRAMVRKGILHEAHPWHERNAEEILRNAPSSGKAVAEFMELYLGARFDTRDHTSTADLRQAGRELLKEVSKTA